MVVTVAKTTALLIECALLLDIMAIELHALLRLLEDQNMIATIHLEVGGLTKDPAAARHKDAGREVLP